MAGPGILKNWFHLRVLSAVGRPRMLSFVVIVVTGFTGVTTQLERANVAAANSNKCAFIVWESLVHSSSTLRRECRMLLLVLLVVKEIARRLLEL